MNVETRRRLGGWFGNLVLIALVGGCGIFWTSQGTRDDSAELLEQVPPLSAVDDEPAAGEGEPEPPLADPGPYEIDVVEVPGGTVRVEPASAVFARDEIVTITAIPDVTSRFTGWSGDLAGSRNPAVVRMAADLIVTPTFSSVVDITVQTIGEGQVLASGPTDDASIGETITFSAIPGDGRALQAWITDPASVPGWWSTRWDYRVPVAVTIAAPAGLSNAVASIAIDFDAAVELMGDDAPFDPNSIRVVEVDGAGEIVSASVAFAFEPPPDGESIASLRVLLEGTSLSAQVRGFHVYFDTVFGAHVEVGSGEIAAANTPLDDLAIVVGSPETFEVELLRDPTLTITLTGDVTVQAIFETG